MWRELVGLLNLRGSGWHGAVTQLDEEEASECTGQEDSTIVACSQTSGAREFLQEQLLQE